MAPCVQARILQERFASGAQSTFLERTFMYGTTALREEGANHIIAVLKRQPQQVMNQDLLQESGRFHGLSYKSD